MKTLIAILVADLCAGLGLWLMVNMHVTESVNEDIKRQSLRAFPDVQTTNPQQTNKLQNTFNPQQRI